MIVLRAALIRRGPDLPVLVVADWQPLALAEVRGIDWGRMTLTIERTPGNERIEHGYRHRLVLDQGPAGINDYLADIEIEYGDPFDWRI